MRGRHRARCGELIYLENRIEYRWPKILEPSLEWSAPALARLPPEHPERSFAAFLKSRGRHGSPHYSDLTESSWDVAKYSMRVIDFIIVVFLSFCHSEAKGSRGGGWHERNSEYDTSGGDQAATCRVTDL